MGHRGHSAEQWSVWIDEQRDSGLTIASFCGSIGVSENSFYVWRRKLRARGDATGPAEASPSEGFVPLSIVESDGTGDRIEIDLPCGAVVRVPDNELLIRQTLEVLLEFGTMNSPSSASSAGGSSC